MKQQLLRQLELVKEMSYEPGELVKILIPGDLTREWLSTRTNIEVQRQLDHTESYLETLFPSTQLLDSPSTKRGIWKTITNTCLES